MFQNTNKLTSGKKVSKHFHKNNKGDAKKLKIQLSESERCFCVLC